MKLTNAHIQELFKFTRKHFVEHYDVQTELVDHLANDIEEIWVAKPHLSFEEARDISFKKFGIFGFMDVVEAKQKRLGKKYRTILLTYMKDWFSIPKILVTLSIFFFFYYVMSVNISKSYLSALMLVLGIIDVVLASKLSKKAKQRFQEKNRKYLLEDMIFKAGAFSSVLIFSNLFNLSSLLRSTDTFYFKICIAALITIAIIYSYISLLIIPQKAEELLEETYPEYKIS